MKNIHILTTSQPSRLISSGKEFNLLDKSVIDKRCKNIYIASNEEIKKGDWFHLDMTDNNHPDEIHQMGKNNWSKTGGINFNNNSSWSRCCKKIILTTDQFLIQDGVQSISDEFLEWFVKNPSCEEVEVKLKQHFEADKSKRKNILNGVYYSYRIIIPKEETKQETLEEVAKEFFRKFKHSYSPDNYYLALVKFAKWQQERMYSEEEMLGFAWFLVKNIGQYSCDETAHFEGKYLEQFKKK